MSLVFYLPNTLNLRNRNCWQQDIPSEFSVYPGAAWFTPYLSLYCAIIGVIITATQRVPEVCLARVGLRCSHRNFRYFYGITDSWPFFFFCIITLRVCLSHGRKILFRKFMILAEEEESGGYFVFVDCYLWKRRVRSDFKSPGGCFFILFFEKRVTVKQWGLIETDEKSCAILKLKVLLHTAWLIKKKKLRSLNEILFFFFRNQISFLKQFCNWFVNNC